MKKGSKKKPKEKDRRKITEARKKKEAPRYIEIEIPYIVPVIAIVLVIVFLVWTFYPSLFYRQATEGQPSAPEETTTTSTIYLQSICDVLEINVNTMMEAANYYRFGIQKPALQGSKFIVLNLTVVNTGDTHRDFSGYRIELQADNRTYIPLRFDDIERLTLSDSSVIDYSCEELKMAYPSRFELDTGGSATGCKIFQILEDLEPKWLTFFTIEGLKCKTFI